MKRIAVFCGSNSGSNPAYAKAAMELGASLVRNELGLVYGGGRVGLMGVVADSVLSAGGEVIGVIPDVLMSTEQAHRGLADLRVTRSMHERKALMADLVDGFIALPGGFGTLDEFCEILTWAQIGIHGKPCGLLNINGFFDSFLTFVRHAVAERFIRENHAGLILESKNSDDMIAQLRAWKPIAEPVVKTIPPQP